MSSTAPVVSCIIPCFGQGSYLRAALMSLAASTRELHEAIIVNDGSIDRPTMRALMRLQPEGDHQSVVVLSQPNRGLAAARNLGLTAAQGEYVQFLDADDMLLRGALDSQLNVMRCVNDASIARPEIAIGGYVTLEEGSLEVRSPKGFWGALTRLSAREVVLKWERGLSVPIHCALFRRGVLNGTDWFEESLRSKEDWLFWVDVLSRAPKVALNFQDVALYRLHGANMTRTSVAKNGFYWLRAIEMGRERFPELFDEFACYEAEMHFERHYMHLLWGSLGPSLPWTLMTVADLGSEGP